ncbi:MAG: potassium transporter TrkG, partial [Bacteroidota bacterium]
MAPFILTLGAIALILWDAGFSQAEAMQIFTDNLYPWVLGALLLLIPLRFFFLKSADEQKKRWVIDTLLWLALMGLFLCLEPLSGFASTLSRTEKTVLFFVLIFCFLKEALLFTRNIKYKQTHPSLIFTISFAGLILVGTLLLLLPRATHTGITPTDALFTSTSAVCVTGLIVVDTGSYFTQFGQTIILVLIQLGGIGIMTFTSFFAFFFRGGVSYRNLILLGNITNEEKMSEIVQTLKKILLLTFIIEAIGMVFILWHMPKDYADTFAQELFFALFHSVSAFCNAGFSTLENSFFEYQFRFRYGLHLTIALLFIVGGLGFPVILNLYIYV